MQPLDVKDKLPSFWTIQLVGWVIYLIVIYITFLSIAQPENFLNLFYLKAFRALTGFFLTSVFLRQIYRVFGNRLSIVSLILLVLFCATLFGCVWTIVEFIYAYLMNPVLKLDNYLARSPRIALDFAMTLTAWSALYLGVKNWIGWQKERENALQANFLADKAQLEVLRYQLNPHFLFNALNSIRASIDEDKQRAKHLVTEFSEFLRYSLTSNEASNIPLREELSAIRNYLAIEKIRFEEKLDVRFEIEPQAEDYQLPSFLIYPLVENAIKYGMNQDEPMRLHISACAINGKLHIEVANTGHWKINENGDSLGIGLRNVEQRLAQLFPDRSRFEIAETDGWVRAKIEINEF